MGRKKLSTEEKCRALTMIQCGFSITRVAADLHVSRQALHKLKRTAARLPSCRTPPRKVGTGRKKKTTARTDALMRRDVMIDPSITAAALKKKHIQLLQNVSVRTIQHRLQKDLKMPCRRAAKKPLLTKAMMKKRVSFCKKNICTGLWQIGEKLCLVMKVHLDWLEEGISWSGGLKECQGMPPSTRSKQSNTLKA